MTDNIVRTIAALRSGKRSARFDITNEEFLALCDAAEAGLRAEKRGEGTTHWGGCWRYHHECAVAKIESERERKAGSIPARLPRSGEKGAGFDSPVMDSGEPKGTVGPTVKAEAESSAGAPINEGGQDAAARKDAGPIANGLMAPVPPSPDAALADFIKPTTPSTCVSRGYEIGERCVDATDCVKNGCAEARPAAPAPPSPGVPVRRFHCFGQVDGVYESPTGAHVNYADYARLTAELDEARAECERLRVDAAKWLNLLRGYREMVNAVAPYFDNQSIALWLNVSNAGATVDAALAAIDAGRKQP